MGNYCGSGCGNYFSSPISSMPLQMYAPNNGYKTTHLADYFSLGVSYFGNLRY
ncbi:MAG: hypothetical protein ABIJ34_07960 [archaeon]